MKKCPLCNSTIARAPRSKFLRQIRAIVDIYKFKCDSKKCNWEGIIVSQLGKKKLINNFLLGILLLALAVGVIGIFYAVELNNEMQRANLINNYVSTPSK